MVVEQQLRIAPFWLSIYYLGLLVALSSSSRRRRTNNIIPEHGVNSCSNPSPSPLLLSLQASDGSSSVGVFPASTQALTTTTTANNSSSSNNSQSITTTTATLASSLPGVASGPSAPRKSDFPTTGLPPLSNGPLGSASPVPLPGTAPPAPSPATAALPPPSLPYPQAVTAPIQVSNGQGSNSNSTSSTNLTSGAPPRPLSHSSGTSFPLPPLPPNSTNSINHPSSNTTTNSSSTANGTSIPSDSKAAASKGPGQQMGAPNVNGGSMSHPPSTQASPLKGGVPTVGGSDASAAFKGPAINGYGPGSPSNGHLPSGAPGPNSRLSAMHSPAGHYGPPGMHPHSHLPLHHPMHQHTLPPVGLAQPPTAAAPTATAPIIHPPPSLDSAAAATGRTNSPAVATSASHSSAASPLINGNGLNPVTSMPGGMPPMLGGPLGLLNSVPNGVGSVLMGTSTGPPPPPIPTLPYGHRGGVLVPPPVSSLYSNFPLYSPYAGLHNPYLPPMAGGPLPPLPLVPSVVASSSSPGHMSSSFSINKLTSSTPPSTTTTSASMAANGSTIPSGSKSSSSTSSNSGRIGDLKAGAGSGVRPGSPANSSSSISSNHMLPEHHHMHHLQHYGQPPQQQHSSHVPGQAHHQQQQQQSAATTQQRATAHSPRGHSPNRERDSYSSNVSSLSRSSVPPYGGPSNSNAAGQSPSLPGSSSVLAAGTPPAIGGIPPSSSAAISSSLAYPKSTWSR